MPMYEYACGTCETRFEELVRGDSAVVCPGCGSREAERLLSRFAGPSRPAPVADYRRLAHHGRSGGGCSGGACGHHH